jgi:hypothetical protein
MTRGVFLLWLALVAVGVAACAAQPERVTLDQFFNASKALDKAALEHVATVTFDPQANGVVEKFDIVNVKSDPDSKKIVTVAAQVKIAGQAELTDKTIVLTLAKRASQKDTADGEQWIVTGFIERLGTPMTPRS